MKPTNESTTSPTDPERPQASSGAHGSAFIVKTAIAYHRAEQDAFANLAQALGVCPANEWPWASKRCGRKQNDLVGRLWTWAMLRWGKRWPDTEYAVRERTPNAALCEAADKKR